MRAICWLFLIPLLTSAPSVCMAQGTSVRLTYLGNAGWEITDGSVIVLVDPYLSRLRNDRRPSPPGDDRRVTRMETDPLISDTATINRRIAGAHYILVTHGHFDHMMDVPLIALRTGAKIVGHETVANLARAHGVPDSALITVRGGEDYDFGAFSLRVVPNLHTVTSHRVPLTGTAPKGLEAPLRYADFVEGGNLAYLVRLADQKVLVIGSMNYIERELQGLNPDVAIVGASAARREIYRYTSRLMQALSSPPLVIPNHWDRSWYPYDMPQDEAIRQVGEFVDEVRRASPRTRVVIPRYFEPIVLTSRK